jgi:hypothetical protein
MACYATWFVATDADLTRYWPGWRLPRIFPQPMKRRVVNPFTGADMEITLLWEDPRDDGDTSRSRTVTDANGRPPMLPVVAPTTAYWHALEKDVPALLKTFPHFASHQISPIEVAAFVKALLGRESPPARTQCQPEVAGNPIRWRRPGP